VCHRKHPNEKRKGGTEYEARKKKSKAKKEKKKALAAEKIAASAQAEAEMKEFQEKDPVNEAYGAELYDTDDVSTDSSDDGEESQEDSDATSESTEGEDELYSSTSTETDEDGNSDTEGETDESDTETDTDEDAEQGANNTTRGSRDLVKLAAGVEGMKITTLDIKEEFLQATGYMTEPGPRRSERVHKPSAPKVFADIMEDGVGNEMHAAFIESDVEDAMINSNSSSGSRDASDEILTATVCSECNGESMEYDELCSKCHPAIQEAMLADHERGLMDSGCFDYLIGTDVIAKVFNIKTCIPTRVRTAGNIVTLREKGSLMLRNGVVLTDCYLNPHAKSSLFCTKRLAKELGWSISIQAWTGKTTIRIDGVELDVVEEGNLCYLPESLAPVHPEQLMYEDALAMTCKLDTGGDNEQKLHEENGHFPPMKGCDVCIRAYMQASGAKTGGSMTNNPEVTLGVDTLDWLEKDANGKRYTQTTVVRQTRLPITRATAENGAGHAKNAFSKTLGWLEAVSAKGPKGEPYKVDRVHHDQGSEFKGEFREQLDAKGIRPTDGEADRHTDNAIVEGMQKILQRGACALGIHAIDNEIVSSKLTSEATNWVTQLIQERQLTPMQKELGISAWEEQTGTPNRLRRMKGYGVWGRLAYGFVKKKDRDGKMSDKAYRGIWTGFDMDVQGAHRIVPYQENSDGTLTLFRTRVTKTALIFNAVFPLRQQVRDLEAIKKIETDLTWQIVGDLSEEMLTKTFTEDTVEPTD
jgi:hypothetical protein